MSASSFDFQQLWNIFSTLLFQLATFGICLYYVINKQNIDSILLTCGSFIHLLTSIFYTVIYPIIIRNGGYRFSGSPIMLIINAISFIGSVLFVGGLIILIINHVSKMNKATY
jgi:membrane protein YdbS with pleckstrin-like domain